MNEMDIINIKKYINNKNIYKLTEKELKHFKKILGEK